ncbi:uncharacterized protein [Periplaneta americana]|uniref:uncharacterized protein isoform X1 n=1 Tax=Periplaneta americana TaxID=6978 RepID=UPI0037E73946
MLLLLCLTLFAGAIFTSSNGCDIGPLPFTNFDFNKYNGQWIWLYYTKSDVFSTIGCILDVNIPQGDESVTITVSYNRVQKRNQVIKGFVREWNSTGYSHEYDNISVPWSNNLFIMGIDYEKYVITKCCLVGEATPHIYVGFRMMNPNEDAIEAANKTLQENGMSLKDLGRFSDCDESWKLLGVES